MPLLCVRIQNILCLAGYQDTIYRLDVVILVRRTANSAVDNLQVR